MGSDRQRKTAHQAHARPPSVSQPFPQRVTAQQCTIQKPQGRQGGWCTRKATLTCCSMLHDTSQASSTSSVRCKRHSEWHRDAWMQRTNGERAYYKGRVCTHTAHAHMVTALTRHREHVAEWQDSLQRTRWPAPPPGRGTACAGAPPPSSTREQGGSPRTLCGTAGGSGSGD